jgi:hypothetical protein
MLGLARHRRAMVLMWLVLLLRLLASYILRALQNLDRVSVTGLRRASRCAAMRGITRERLLLLGCWLRGRLRRGLLQFGVKEVTLRH